MSYRKLHLNADAKPGEFGTYRRHLSRNTELNGVHVHDFIELFWVEKGPGLHWINGERRVVSPGVLQLVRANDAHLLYALPGIDFEWTNVAFYPASWHALRRRYFSNGVRFFDVRSVSGREFRLSKDQQATLRMAAVDLAHGARDLAAFERFLFNALALISSVERVSSDVPLWLRQLDQELRQQVNFSRGVAAVVGEAGRCAEHVCREYRRYFGRTPTETMTVARMEYASSQLENTEMKIVDLALEVGLQNLGYFYRTFEAHFRCTPREYRRQLARARGVRVPRE